MSAAPIAYLRWATDQPRQSRLFPTMADDHPFADHLCVLCDNRLAGQRTQMLALGPGADPDARARHDAGRWYTVPALLVHADCLRAQEPE